MSTHTKAFRMVATVFVLCCVLLLSGCSSTAHGRSLVPVTRALQAREVLRVKVVDGAHPFRRRDAYVEALADSTEESHAVDSGASAAAAASSSATTATTAPQPSSSTAEASSSATAATSAPSSSHHGASGSASAGASTASASSATVTESSSSSTESTATQPSHHGSSSSSVTTTDDSSDSSSAVSGPAPATTTAPVESSDESTEDSRSKSASQASESDSRSAAANATASSSSSSDALEDDSSESTSSSSSSETATSASGSASKPAPVLPSSSAASSSSSSSSSAGSASSEPTIVFTGETTRLLTVVVSGAAQQTAEQIISSFCASKGTSATVYAVQDTMAVEKSSGYWQQVPSSAANTAADAYYRSFVRVKSDKAVLDAFVSAAKAGSIEGVVEADNWTSTNTKASKAWIAGLVIAIVFAVGAEVMVVLQFIYKRRHRRASVYSDTGLYEDMEMAHQNAAAAGFGSVGALGVAPSLPARERNAKW